MYGPPTGLRRSDLLPLVGIIISYPTPSQMHQQYEQNHKTDKQISTENVNSVNTFEN